MAKILVEKKEKKDKSHTGSESHRGAYSHPWPQSSSPLLGPGQELCQAWADRPRDSEKGMEGAERDEGGSAELAPCSKGKSLDEGILLLWLPSGVLSPCRGGLWKVSTA